MLKFDKASGLYYDRDSGLIYADKMEQQISVV
jgi:hypothetical protein